MSSPTVVLHLSANDVKDKLLNSPDFRMRLNFKMGEKNVVCDGRNINFRAKLPDVDTEVQVFQVSEIKWVNNTIVILCRYVFSIDASLIKVEATRVLTAAGSSSCNSKVTVALCENELSEDAGKLAVKYITQRHKEEDTLLNVAQSSQLALPNSMAVPYDAAFANVRDTLEQIDRFLHDESSIDPSVLATRRELDELHNEITEATSRIEHALNGRHATQTEIHNESQRVATAAAAIETALADPMRNTESADTKNDVAFAVSLIPLAVAVLGLVLRWRKTVH